MRRLLAFTLTLAWMQATATAAQARPRQASSTRKAPSYRVHSQLDATTTPAYRYGTINAEACEGELTARGIAFEPEPARGVRSAVRIAGPIRGITFRTNLRAEARETTRWELADCRLVLALDDLARILERHDIVEVRHFSMYRPPPRTWPEDKQATRHAGALAIDVGRLITRAGDVLDVDDDFHGRIGARTCGPRAAPRRKTAAALKLREILCELVAARLFNVVLTPNHNRAHKNHFHLDLTPGVRWFIVD